MENIVLHLINNWELARTPFVNDTHRVIQGYTQQTSHKALSFDTNLRYNCPKLNKRRLVGNPANR